MAKNTVFTDVIKGVVSAMDDADAGLKKYATPEKTQYERNQEWKKKTVAEIRAMPPGEAIKQLMKHRSK
jgi:hypothetical protein